MSNLSTVEMQQAVTSLSKLEPGFLPPELFLQIARLYVTAIIELVPLRKTPSGVEVLLLQRPPSDPNWPSKLHTPGTVLRATDVVNSGLNTAFTRLYADELRITSDLAPVFVTHVLHKVARGTEFATIFYAEIINSGPTGTWYPASQLPDNLVDSQQAFIMSAVEAFERSTQE